MPVRKEMCRAEPGLRLTSVKLRPDVRAALIAAARLREVSLTRVVEAACEEWLARHAADAAEERAAAPKAA